MKCVCAVLSCVACPALHYFYTLSLNDFRKKREKKRLVTEHRICVLISSTAFVWSISHSEKNWSRYDQKCILVFMWSTRYSCPIVMKLEFSGRFFENYSNIKFQYYPSSGSRVVPCGRTDGRTDTTKLIVAFRNSANTRKNVRSHKTWLNFSMLCYNVAGFVIFYKHLILFLSQQWSCTCLYVVVLCVWEWWPLTHLCEHRTEHSGYIKNVGNFWLKDC